MRHSWIFALALVATSGCGLEVESESPGQFTGSVPADGATAVDVDNEIVLIFNESVADESADAQPEDGPCQERKIQVSTDDFVNCLGGLASVVANAEKHKLQWVGKTPLAPSTLYKVRVMDVLFDVFEPQDGMSEISFSTNATVADGIRNY